MSLRPLFLATALLLTTLTGAAQQPPAGSHPVSGTVRDAKSGSPLRNANVVALHLPDSSMKGGAVTSSDGRFEIANLARGRYLLRVTYIGYAPLTWPFTVADRPVRLGNLELTEESIRLGDVEVTGRVVPAEVKGDTTEFRAGAFKTNPDATAEDLVGKLPGVTTEGGTVRAQNEQVRQVLVDNKPFFGTDPTAALRALPAELVDRIQIFDQQSEQSRFTGFDDGNTSKTINIVTRQNMRNGQFGKATAGYGDEDRYKVNAMLNLFNDGQRVTILGMSNNVNEQNFAIEDIIGATGQSGGPMGGAARNVFSMIGGGSGGSRLLQLGGMGGGRGGMGGDIGNFLVTPRGGVSTTNAVGLNYSDTWGAPVEVSGSYFFNVGDNNATSDLTRQFVLSGVGDQLYAETELASNQTMNHRFNFRMEWTIDSLNSILFRPRLSAQESEGNSLLTGATTIGGSPLNASSTRRSSDLLGLNSSAELLYRRRFETRGRSFSISVTSGLNNSSGNAALRSEYASFASLFTSDTLDQQADLDRTGWNAGASVSYTEPLADGHQLQARYSIDENRNESDKSTFNLDPFTGRYTELDTFYTNRYDNRYRTHSGGLDYRYSDDEFNMSFGASYQAARLSGEQRFPYATSVLRTYDDVLPSAQFRWRLSREKNLFFNYRTRTNPPSIEQLQNVVDNSNPLQLRSGNPELEQDYTHSLMLRYSSTAFMQMTYFFAMLSGSITNNAVGTSTIIASRDTVIDNISLARGTQLSRPVNVDGSASIRGMATYGMPITAIKSTTNFSVFGNLSRTIGLINGVENDVLTPSVGGSVVIASNISPEVDFTVSSLSIYSTVSNSLQSTLNTEYFTQNTRARLNWIIWEGIVLTTDLSHSYSSGLSEGYNQNFLLWNVGLAKKFLKNDAAEIRISLFDALNQNRSSNRTSTEWYIEDLRTDVLRRHALLSFSYNFRNFTDQK